MFITQIEIDNFKSFVKKTRIPFYQGVTIISGPNGSGKSNIIDSILFALSLSGSRTLRAEKLTDLINLNSGKNSAEVKITFSDGTNIRRRIKRTSNGYYSYSYLNDRICKQTEIIDFLAKYGIKPHGYNVVMQGDITRIIEMSDFERRKVLDEIAGVAEFDAKKDQALSELEVVRERIEREEILLHELNIRMGELRQEREQALLYRDWQEKLAHFESCRNAAKMHELKRELASIAKLLEDQQIGMDRISSDRSHEENELAYFRDDLADIDSQIKKKSGSDYLKLIADLEESKSAIKMAEQTITRLGREKENNLEGINRNYMDMKRAEARVTECGDNIRSLGIDRTNLSMELATARAQLEKVDAEIQRLSKDTEQAQSRLFELMKSAEEKKNDRSAVLHQQDMLLERSRMRTSEIERLEERISSVDSEIEGKSREKEDIEKKIAGAGTAKKKLERDLSTLESDVFARRGTLESIRMEIRENEQEVIRLEAMRQARGEAGSRALKAVLGMDGVYGTIAQLGKAPQEYATSLNVSAGGKHNYVVVEDDGIATQAIRYLKHNRLGRVTFLPLTKLKKMSLPPLQEDGVIDYAISLLEFDSKFERAFGVVFGRTVVVSTLDRARELLGRYRMVTLEGELLQTSGAMTGGSLKKTVGGFGTAVEDDIERIRVKISELEEEASDLAASIRRDESVVDGMRKERSDADSQIERFRIKIEEYENQCGSLVAEKEAVKQSLQKLKEEVHKGAGDLAALEERLDAATDEISRLNNEIENIRKQLADTDIPVLSTRLEKCKSEVEEFERKLRNKEADISEFQRERQHFKNRLDELEAERERLLEKNRQIDADIVLGKEQIEEGKQRIVEIEKRQKQFSSEIEELQKKRDEVLGEIQASERRLLDFDTELERGKIQMDALRDREKVTAVEFEELQKEAGDIETDLSLREIEDGIAEAQREMRKIGAVNMLAINDYERVCKRVEERTGKKEVLSRERSTVIERIEQFERMKYDAFMTSFRAIDGNFRDIFARLTSGSGHLVLENDDDPFSGGLSFAIKPRDKPVHLLSALSGGEKSLTTLAFIFSIQQYIPAPFYAFDEVDMSLDGSNVERISGMIGELSHESQFIIVSLRKPMIDGADRIVGVTLHQDKSTLVTGVKVNE